MRLLRFAKLAALVIAVSAFILVASVSVYFRIEQYRLRGQAERLLSDVRELELKKATPTDVRLVVGKWGFEVWQGPGNACTEDRCIYRLRFMAGPARTNRFADPFIGKPTAHIFDWLGLRPSAIQASVEIRGKTLRSVSFSVDTLGRGCDGRGRLDCTLTGYADTKQRGSGWSSHQQADVKLRQSLLHPNYLVGASRELLNPDTGGSPAVVIWAELSPDATTEEVSRLMQFDLSCLTRLRSCRERDLMPTVWAQSLEDIRKSQKVLTCTPELSQRVAQLADTIALVRPKTAELSPSLYEGRSPQLRDLEIVNVIKKPAHRSPQLANVDVDQPVMMTTSDTKSPLRADQEYVFLLQVRFTPDTAWMALYPCGVLSSNDASLAMVREMAAKRSSLEVQ
jgi:hypothetical protein